MKLAVLFSGGKDSAYALMKAMEYEEVVCLISIISENKESYMFHTPNINITKLQAEAIGIPIIQKVTKGEKEKELAELKDAIAKAKEEYSVEGIVTGAIESVYQADRVQRICNELSLWCFNPLWKKDQVELLKEIIDNKFKVIISGVFAYPLEEEWLGKEIDEQLMSKLIEMKEKHKISPTGEGGELETTALFAPYFKKKILIKESKTEWDGSSGTLIIKGAELE